MFGPVPPVLTLDNAHYSVDLQHHSRVAGVGSGSVLDDLVYSVESGDGQEISGFDLVGG